MKTFNISLAAAAVIIGALAANASNAQVRFNDAKISSTKAAISFAVGSSKEITKPAAPASNERNLCTIQCQRETTRDDGTWCTYVYAPDGTIITEHCSTNIPANSNGCQDKANNFRCTPIGKKKCGGGVNYEHYNEDGTKSKIPNGSVASCPAAA